MEIFMPLVRYACWRNLSRIFCQSNSGIFPSFWAKISGSGSNVMEVPGFWHLPPFWPLDFGLPLWYSCAQCSPSRQTSARIQEESAFTTDTPTPCSPPETLYPVPPNFPPAWSMVITVSSADFFVCLWTSIGIPRPSSVTRTRWFGKSVTKIFLAYPAIASSMELSTTSQIKWCRPSAPVEPIYIPGRFRTGSKPSNTKISLAVYDPPSPHSFLGLIFPPCRRAGLAFLSINLIQSYTKILAQKSARHKPQNLTKKCILIYNRQQKKGGTAPCRFTWARMYLKKFCLRSVATSR